MQQSPITSVLHVRNNVGAINKILTIMRGKFVCLFACLSVRLSIIPFWRLLCGTVVDPDRGV